MKIVFSYCDFGPHIKKWTRDLAAAAPDKIHVVPTCVSFGETTILTWPELDRLWRRRDKNLLKVYDELIKKTEEADVLFAYGTNIHPELLQSLRTFNVYMFNDDPEDSPWQSEKIAPHFDAILHSNVSSGPYYRSLGCRRVAWQPIFTYPAEVCSTLTGEDDFLAGRDNEIVFVGGLGGYSDYRRERLSMLHQAFPGAKCYGRGWPGGTISFEDLKACYLRSRIGWNLHRTTGPINRRMFQLPAHGVLQICDNKTGLAEVFEL